MATEPKFMQGRKVTVPAHKLIVVDENNGGYYSGHCVVCEEHGYLDIEAGASNGINHKPGFPVTRKDEKKVV